MLKGNKRSAGQLAGVSRAAGFLLTLRWLPRPWPPPATPTRSCRRQRFPAALAGRGASQEVEKPFLPLPRHLLLHQLWQKPPGAGWVLMHRPQVFLQGHVSFPVGTELWRGAEHGTGWVVAMAWVLCHSLHMPALCWARLWGQLHEWG